MCVSDGHVNGEVDHYIWAALCERWMCKNVAVTHAHVTVCFKGAENGCWFSARAVVKHLMSTEQRVSCVFSASCVTLFACVHFQRVLVKS